MIRLILLIPAIILCLLPVLSGAELAGTVSGDYEPLYSWAARSALTI